MDSTCLRVTGDYIKDTRFLNNIALLVEHINKEFNYSMEVIYYGRKSSIK